MPYVLQAFLRILRSHYKENDSTYVFQEMSNSVQLPSESELDFCLRVMSLREKVLALSRDEACPFDENMVRKRFFHALSSYWFEAQQHAFRIKKKCLNLAMLLMRNYYMKFV